MTVQSSEEVLSLRQDCGYLLPTVLVSVLWDDEKKTQTSCMCDWSLILLLVHLICFMCGVEMWALSFLLLLPSLKPAAVMSFCHDGLLPLWHQSQIDSLFHRPLWVMVLYHSNRKVTNGYNSHLIQEDKSTVNSTIPRSRKGLGWLAKSEEGSWRQTDSMGVFNSALHYQCSRPTLSSFYLWDISATTDYNLELKVN